VRSDLLNHQVASEMVLAPDLPTVRGDRVQLQQVLLNLVMNACDAMVGSDRAGRLLCVSTQWIAGEGVRVSVRDHGPGIPAEVPCSISHFPRTTVPRHEPATAHCFPG